MVVGFNHMRKLESSGFERVCLNTEKRLSGNAMMAVVVTGKDLVIGKDVATEKEHITNTDPCTENETVTGKCSDGSHCHWEREPQCGRPSRSATDRRTVAGRPLGR